MDNKSKIKKLDSGVYEIRTPITHEEVITVNLDVLNEDIRTATEALGRRESELTSARARLTELQELKAKLIKEK